MRRRGMTLMELIVALTMLVTITTLVAALWGQMRRWSEDSASVGALLQPRRAADFVRAQWAERRAVTPLGPGEPAAARIDQDALEFVTSMPALFPEWPLVVARYRIERGDTPTGLAVDAASRLIYEETRIVRLDGLAELTQGGVDANGDELARSVTLLDDCVGLRWEALAPGGAPRGAARGEAGGGPLEWRPLDARSPLALQRTTPDGTERIAGRQTPEGSERSLGRAAADAPGGRASEVEGAGPSPARAAEPDDVEPPRAIRLAGRTGGKEFAWSLVVADSR